MVHVADQETIAGALITGLVTIAGAIRLSAGRIAKSNERAKNAMTAVMLEFSKTSATLSAKFDNLAAKFDSLAARFDRIVDTLLRDRDRRAARRRTEEKRRPTTSRGHGGGRVGDDDGDRAGSDEVNLDDLADERG